jgi:hypothetical protein
LAKVIISESNSISSPSRIAGLFSLQNNIIPVCPIINWREKTIMQPSGPTGPDSLLKGVVMNATLLASAFGPDGKHPAAAVRLDPSGSRMHLAEGRYLRAEQARGWTVRALAGTVWITQDHDVRDIILQAGEKFVLDREGSALLWPFGEAEICMERRQAHKEN